MSGSPMFVSNGVVRRKTYTTGQIAKLCNVANRTVAKWIDSGKLKGYRIPGSSDRRVLHFELVLFLRANNMPTFGIDVEFSILVVGIQVDMYNETTKLVTSDQFRFNFAETPYVAGIKFINECPNLVILDTTINRSEIAVIVHSMKKRTNPPAIVCILAEDEINKYEIIQAGADDTIDAPLHPIKLFDCIEKWTIGQSMKKQDRLKEIYRL